MNPKYRIIYPLQKSFNQNSIPPVFNELNLEGGKYFWGLGSVEKLDTQGEIIDADALRKRAPEFIKAPYNKVFITHDHKNLPAGTIVMSKYIEDLNKYFEGSQIDTSKMPKAAHVLVGKLNESLPEADSVWGSLNNGNLDSWSIYGSKPVRKDVYNKDTGMNEVHITDFEPPYEASLTPIPINDESLVYGTFQKGGFGIEFIEKKNSVEANKMVEDTDKYVTKEDFEKSNTAVNDKLDKISKGLEDFQKAVEDDKKKAEEAIKKAEGEEKKDETPKEEAPKEEDKEEEKKEEDKPAEKAVEKAARGSAIKGMEKEKPIQKSNDMPILNHLFTGRAI